MSDLRDRLAGKARRRITVSVALSDATEAVGRATKIERELLFATAGNGTADTKAEIEARLDAVREEIRGHYADIEFVACQPGDFEALQTDFTGTDGGIDAEKLSANLPAIAAACAAEEDLRDEDFWRTQFESGAWTYGERASLANRLIALNMAAPDERIPFA